MPELLLAKATKNSVQLRVESSGERTCKRRSAMHLEVVLSLVEGRRSLLREEVVHRVINLGQAAVRINSNRNGRVNQFGWLQAAATRRFCTIDSRIPATGRIDKDEDRPACHAAG